MRGVAPFPFGRDRPRWDPGEAASPPEPHRPAAAPGRLCATHRAQMKPRKPLRSAAPKPRRKGVAPSAITPLLSEGQRGGQTPFPPRHRTPLRSPPPPLPTEYMGAPRRARPGAAAAAVAAMVLRAPPRRPAPRSPGLPRRGGRTPAAASRGAHGPARPRLVCPARCSGRGGGRGDRAMGGAILVATGAARGQTSFCPPARDSHGVAGAVPPAGGGARHPLRPGWVSGAAPRAAGGAE